MGQNKKDILLRVLKEYKELGIDEQIDYQKFYLYSLITHSTAIEGSTVTEIENQLLFDEGITAKGRSLQEQMMNLDLKAAYEQCLKLAERHDTKVTIDMLKSLAAIVMKNTGCTYNTALGSFSSANGDIRLLNVTAGTGGRSYMNYQKVPQRLHEFCDSLNERRQQMKSNDFLAAYNLSFDAHFQLVTIHPWADGNGRMSRLLMHFLQFENNLIPVKITKEQKGEYIQALIDTRENDNLDIFRQTMLDIHISNLQQEITAFKKSMEDNFIGDKPKDVTDVTDRQKTILGIIRANNNITTVSLAEQLGITKRTVLRDIDILKKAGLLKRIGSEKTGHWEIDCSQTSTSEAFI